MEKASQVSDQIMNFIYIRGPEILLAIIVLIVGLFLIKRFSKWGEKRMNKRHVDPSLIPFLIGTVRFLLIVLLLISVASMVGIHSASFIAVLGAAGLAIGLALQGSLSNFAGGVLILLFKPFRVGEYIEGQGTSGTVEKIEILYTTLKTPDNKMIVIPNGPLANSVTTNYSRHDTRRCDFTFGISYDSNIKKARKVILDTLQSDERVFKDPAPVVVLQSLGDSAVNLVTRVWLKSSDLWDVFFEKQEEIKEAFDANNISMPFPQRDIHIIDQTELKLNDAKAKLS